MFIIFIWYIYIDIYIYVCIYHVMKSLLLFDFFCVWKHLSWKMFNTNKNTLPLGLDHPNLDACQLPSDFFDGSATWRCGLKLADLTFEWVAVFQKLTWIKRLDHFFHAQKTSPTKIRKHHCFFAIDMSTEERSWKDCPKGGAVTQALEMPTLTVSSLLKGNEFYLKGCCETKSTSTFFVIAGKEVSKNDGNGILKITIVGLTSKILQNGAGVQVVRTSLLGSCSDSFSQHLRCGIAMPSQELIQNVGFTTKKRQWWVVFHVFVLFLDMLEPLVISYFDQATK